MADDGPLTIHLSHDQPDDPDARANWLPTPDDQFALIIRAYIPEPAILDKTYTLPNVNHRYKHLTPATATPRPLPAAPRTVLAKIEACDATRRARLVVHAALSAALLLSVDTGSLATIASRPPRCCLRT